MSYQQVSIPDEETNQSNSERMFYKCYVRILCYIVGTIVLILLGFFKALFSEPTQSLKYMSVIKPITGPHPGPDSIKLILQRPHVDWDST